jgi:putative oligomerization/nucleic acid binding protein
MLRRRRPLLRAAVVGGGAYLAGKHTARQQAAAQQSGDEQNERIGQFEQPQPQQGGPVSQPPPAQPESPMAGQLSQLAALHQQGVLSDAEFAAAKAKLLST